MLKTWSNHTRTSFPMAHFSTKHHAITIQAYQSKVDSSKKGATLLGDGEKLKGNLKKNKHYFGFFHFFLCLPEFLDPKYNGWKATEMRIHMIKSYKYLEKQFGLQNFVNTLDSKSSHQVTPCLKSVKKT